jgi:peptide/nickel transport system substrate-binding protein
VTRSVRLAGIAAALAAGLLVLIDAAEPGARAANRGTLVVGVTRGDPDTLDPTLTTSFTAVVVLRAIAERLYDFDAKSRVVPELASALPRRSKDKLTYTIPLRHGLRFNDGTAFNAQAVVTTLERDLTLSGSARASDLSPIDTVTASGRYTVVIHLREPFTPLLTTLASNDGVVISPTQLAKLGAQFGTDPVGVGPFMFASRVAGDSITVTRSPYFTGRNAIHLDKIVFKNEPNAAAAVAALEAGDIQMLDSVVPTDLPALRHDGSVRLLTRHSLGWLGLAFNVGNKNGVGRPYGGLSTPFASSPSLRRAFEEAIDRKTLAKVVYAGAAVPDCTPVAPSYDRSVHCTPYNPDDARRLVAQSGFAKPTLQLVAPAAGAGPQLAQFIQAEEAAIGIDVVIDPVDTPTLVSLSNQGQFGAVIMAWTGSPAIDRNVFQFVATTGSRDVGGYSNPRLDLILGNARKAVRGTALRTLYRAAFRILLADRPWIWLNHPVVTAAVSSSVEGVQFLSDIQPRVAYASYR